MALLVTAASLSGCSGGSQALLASGGHQDFAEMNRVSEEFGAGEPDGTVPVVVDGQTQNFRVWVSKSKTRIMVQTGNLAATAAAGFVRGLTAGLVKGEQEYGPLQDAAMAYLAASYGPGCALSNSRKLTRVGWEWDFSCTKAQAKN